MSLTDKAQLYRIDVTSGAATAVGPLGIGFVFEGGLTFDATGRLIGVNRGTDVDAQAFGQHGHGRRDGHRPGRRPGPRHRRPDPRR